MATVLTPRFSGWRLRFTYRQLILMCIVQLVSLAGFYIGVTNKLEAVAQRTSYFSYYNRAISHEEFDTWKAQIANRMQLLERKIDKK